MRPSMPQAWPTWNMHSLDEGSLSHLALSWGRSGLEEEACGENLKVVEVEVLRSTSRNPGSAAHCTFQVLPIGCGKVLVLISVMYYGQLPKGNCVVFPFSSDLIAS